MLQQMVEFFNTRNARRRHRVYSRLYMKMNCQASKKVEKFLEYMTDDEDEKSDAEAPGAAGAPRGPQ